MALTSLGIPTAHSGLKGSSTEAGQMVIGMGGIRVVRSKARSFTTMAKLFLRSIGMKTVSKLIRPKRHEVSDCYWREGDLRQEQIRGAASPGKAASQLN